MFLDANDTQDILCKLIWTKSSLHFQTSSLKPELKLNLTRFESFYKFIKFCCH